MSSSATAQKRLEELNGKLAGLGMRGYGQLRHDPSAWNLSSGAGRADIYPALMETADVVRIGADPTS